MTTYPQILDTFECPGGLALTVTKSRTRRGEIIYSYENDCGAIVATRTLLKHSWRARLYTSPNDWESYYGLSDNMAEKMCLDHVSKF